MLLNLSYHHVDHSDAFREYLFERVRNMNNHLRGVQGMKFMASKDAGKYNVSVNLSKGHSSFYCQESGNDVYQAAVKVLRKVKRWLHH